MKAITLIETPEPKPRKTVYEVGRDGLRYLSVGSDRLVHAIFTSECEAREYCNKSLSVKSFVIDCETGETLYAKEKES